jgi:hypothetical protein
MSLRLLYQEVWLLWNDPEQSSESSTETYLSFPPEEVMKDILNMVKNDVLVNLLKVKYNDLSVVSVCDTCKLPHPILLENCSFRCTCQICNLSSCNIDLVNICENCNLVLCEWCGLIVCYGRCIFGYTRWGTWCSACNPCKFCGGVKINDEFKINLSLSLTPQDSDYICKVCRLSKRIEEFYSFAKNL